MFTIKVGVMPGKLQEVVVDGELTAKEIFELAEVDYEGHEIRLDGNRINIDEKVNNGNQKFFQRSESRFCTDKD